MKRIDTSLIVDPNVQEPFTGPMLAFLQDGTKEVVQNTILGLIGPSYSTSIVYIIWGCKLTSGVTTGPGNFNIAAGAVFFNGEMYSLDGYISGTLATGQHIYFTTTIVQGPPDPVTFSDGSTKSVCNDNQVALLRASSGTQNFTDWVPIDGDWHLVGGAGEIAFKNSWFVDAIGGAGARWKKEGRFCVLSGIIAGGANGTVAFTLPALVQPVSGATFGQSQLESGTLYQRMITISNNVLGTGTPGDVVINWAGSAGVVCLDGIRFPLD